MKTLALLILLLPAVVLADAAPPSGQVLTPDVKEGVLCLSEADTGDCISGADEIVMDVRGFKTVAFDSTESTATTYTCDVISSAVGHDLNGGSGHDVSSTQISNTAPILAIEGLLRYVWINCSTISGGTVTVWATATRY